MRECKVVKTEAELANWTKNEELLEALEKLRRRIEQDSDIAADVAIEPINSISYFRQQYCLLLSQLSHELHKSSRMRSWEQLKDCQKFIIIILLMGV